MKINISKQGPDHRFSQVRSSQNCSQLADHRAKMVSQLKLIEAIQMRPLYRGMKASVANGTIPFLEATPWGLGVRDTDVTLNAANMVATGGMSVNSQRRGDWVAALCTLDRSYAGMTGTGNRNHKSTAHPEHRWKWQIDSAVLAANNLRSDDTQVGHVLIEPLTPVSLVNFRAAITGIQNQWNRIDPPDA